MGPQIIARNYAETLLTLADRHGGLPTMEEYGRAADEFADLLQREPRIRRFLEAPTTDTESKKQALRSALAGRVPDLFLRFVLVILDKRRQGLFREIAAEYHALLDERLGRVRAEVTLAQEPDLELQREIVQALQRRLNKTVVPRFRVDPTMLGGIIVRVGDEVLDGSVRSRVAGMRRRLLEAQLV